MSSLKGLDAEEGEAGWRITRLEAAAKALRGPAGGRRLGDRAGCGALPASALYGEDSRHGAHRVRRSRLDHGGPPDGVGRLGGGAAAQARGVGSSGRAILAGSPSLLAERRMDYLLGHSPIRIIPRFTKCRSSGAKSRRPKKPKPAAAARASPQPKKLARRRRLPPGRLARRRLGGAAPPPDSGRNPDTLPATRAARPRPPR